MAVYVDPLFSTEPGPNWPFTTACHLMADSVAELLEFAIVKLGMRQSWLQVTSVVHFDLTKNKRHRAVKAGAIEVDNRFRPASYREQVVMARDAKRRGKL